ncbi:MULTISPECIES: fimbria/pilus chaperone family protein [unclassified Pseudomonas]|uniref:fimbria/pilus chaperone family protein n=1 Tax=unclassified Pseudomonas TaxID=196821 RepID=UPI002AC8B0ED|nr:MULTISPECIES: fimbria/pilus chaperone family protein [unclassified Pseudomonas]MEB0047317.1 fimbria/pilus chaperone family protein [Pseudomonas sp. Dout3]MEB0096569.1 fimbria/pilus chaperone family protein [Pseudomonas sp. DC1.2]WPX60310.1 fimbria/pilus chaperone family protein [Pseudomonas sp. DC1.2]
MNTSAKLTSVAFSFLALMAASNLSSAAGMVPETSVVMVSVADGEGTINVTNTDSKAALLYTSLENLPEDTESLLVVTPPVARVEAGEKQLVRFIVQSKTPITTQRLKRVSFEGIPQKGADDKPTVGITVRQNLPVLLSPADLPEKADTWTVLKWSVSGQMLTVKNDSRYVVRLNQQVNVLPSDIKLALPRTYILPGEAHTLQLPAGKSVADNSTIRIYPASAYGYGNKPFDAALSK